jgi:hypothetical protein
MKKNKGIYALICLGSLVGIVIVTVYKDKHQERYQGDLFEINLLSDQLKKGEDDIQFFKEAAFELQILEEKKWFSPERRPVAGRLIKSLCAGFTKCEYAFEPEERIMTQNGTTLKRTTILIDAEAFLDTDIYVFLEKFLEAFPGVVLASEIQLELQGFESIPFIRGRLVFEWFSEGDKE